MSDDKRSPAGSDRPDSREKKSFTVKGGVRGGHDGLPASSGSSESAPGAAGEAGARPRTLPAEEYVRGVREGDRTILARAITLVESNAPAHAALQQEVLQALVPHAGNAVRVGITGVPGVGKSTFIEALGTMLCDAGRRVAVLAVDPSSSLSGGSILGDKTRMDALARHPNAFIRPSPTGGSLGGVTRKSRETMLVCEAAGYDVVLVETVGVGQSESAVRAMVDFFLLLMLAGAGDELQGIKKGIIELADALVITKADGDNKARATAAQAEYDRALHYLAPATKGWRTRAHVSSARTGEGIEAIWQVIERFRESTQASGAWEARRRSQAREWVHALIEDYLHARFFDHPAVRKLLPQVERDVVDGNLPVAAAVQALIQAFEA